MSISQKPGPETPAGPSSLWFWLGMIAVVGAGYYWFRTGGERPLTDLQLTPLTGATTPVTLADLRGKVALVNIWGTWCPPCRVEFPHIVELEKKYRSREDFKLLAVSSSSGGDDRNVQDLRAETAAFLTQQQADLPTYADATGATRRAIGQAVGQHGVYPTTIILDRAGVIQGHWVGYRSGAEVQMDQLIERLLAKPLAEGR